MTDGGIVQLEAGVCDGVITDLKQRGHNISRGPNSGGYQAVMREAASYPDGPGFVLTGATEMRKDGHVAVY